MKKILGMILGVIVCFAGFLTTACTPNYDNISLTSSVNKITLAVNETQTLQFEFENAPSGFVPNLQLNNINNLFSIVSTEIEDNKVYYEIKGLKSGQTTVNALSFEGNKSCSVQVEVFEEITGFEPKTNLFVVAEDGREYVLKNQSYFSYTPANCKLPQLKYTYENQEVSSLIAQKDVLTNNTYIKLVNPNGEILTNAGGQEIRFAQGSVILTAEVLDYTTGEVSADLAKKDVTIQIIPQIKSEGLKLLRKGGILAEATKFYDQNKYITEADTLTIIKNRISDSYMVFELECDTADTTLSITSSLFQCTEIASTDIGELEGYTSSFSASKFFSVQAKDVGTETITISLSYTQSTPFGETNYKKDYSLKLVSITAPYQVMANNVQEYENPIPIFDNAKAPYELFISVLDKLSLFTGVRVELATLQGGELVVNDELFNYLGVTYGTRELRKQSFVVPYTDFSSNTSAYPLKILAKQKTVDQIYVVLTVLPPVVEGSEQLPENIKTAVPFEVKEGIKSFSLSPEFMVQQGLTFVPKTLYLDLNGGERTFDGFIISNIETASLSNFEFKFTEGEDVVLVTQIFEDDQPTKKLLFTPKKVGNASFRVIAQEGYFVDLNISVLAGLDGANLALIPSEDVTATKADENGNISEVQVALRDENSLLLSVLKQNQEAGLFVVNTETSDPDKIFAQVVDNHQITLSLLAVCEDNTYVTLTVLVLAQEATENFDLAVKETGHIEFEVKIYIYSPVSSVDFVSKVTSNDQTTFNKIAGFSLYRQIDVGYKYATLAQAECYLRVTLFNGEVIENVFDYYDTTGSLSINTSYGTLVDRGGSFFINQFGTLSQVEDKLIFACDYEAAQTGSFVFMVTIVDHSVSYTETITISVKTFTPLGYVGITNYQSQIYLSGTNNSFTFFTYTDPEADINKFDVVFEESSPESANLVNVDISPDGTQVVVTHNSSASGGSGYLYFVPTTMFTDGDNFPHDSVQKVKVIYSDGNNKNYPELISTAEEFMSAVTNSSNIAKHYVIMSTIDLGGYTFENVKPLTGSISGGTSGAKIVNVNINVSATSYSQTNIGLFPRIEESGEINNLEFEGSLNIEIGNLGVNKTYAIGLITGENLGSLNNVSVVLNKSNISLTDNASSNKAYIGGVAGINSGKIVNGVSTNAGKDPLIFSFDDTKTNLTTINTKSMLSVIYNGLSTETAVGAVAGLSTGLVERKPLNFPVFNNNIYTVIATLQTQGITATGGVVGQNGTGLGTTAEVKGQITSQNLSARQVLTRGGQNIGGLVGQNFGSVENSTVRGDIAGYDFVGGLIGYDFNPDSVKNCVVQAIKTLSFSPMLKAISANANVNAFSGNQKVVQNASYVQNGCTASMYYQPLPSENLMPIGYAQYNGVLTQFLQGDFVVKTDAVSTLGINQTLGTYKFSQVSGINPNSIAIMFYYQASNPDQQDLLNSLNTNRELPFKFQSTDSITVVSLTPEILTVDAYGGVTLNSTGVATLQVSSVLDKSVVQKLYVVVMNAFDELRVENLSGEKIASGAYINVSSLAPASIKFAFVNKPVEVTAEMGITKTITLAQSPQPVVNITYETAQHYYTTAETYGNVIILSSTACFEGTNRVDNITITPHLTLSLNLDGNEVCASVPNLSEFGLTSTKLDVISLLGTTSLTSNVSNITSEPVDEIQITVTQTTDDSQDTLTLSSLKMLTNSDEQGDYFKIVSQTCSQTFNSETKLYQNVYTFSLKYNYEVYGDGYEGTYYLTFTAKNLTTKTIAVNLVSQTLSNITLKNFYDYGTTYNPAHTQSLNLSSGDYNLLELNLYPYFASYDYLLVKNDPANYDKNNVLLMEAMRLTENGQTLQLLSGAIYDTDGIKIPKQVLESQNILQGESSRIFIRYTTISKATVDTVSKMLISVHKGEIVEYETMLALNIVVKDSVFFTINNRQIAPEYYLAKGLSYDLTLNTYGFTASQAKIEITHEGSATNAVTISQNSLGEYVLKVNKNITYSATASNTQGYEVIVTTYGENVVDGIKYQSGKSTLKLIIADFVILQENLEGYQSGNDIDQFTKQTAIKNAQGAVVSTMLGNAYEMGIQFALNQTIEFDAENPETLQKVQEFEKTLSNLGTFTITATSLSSGVLGKFVENHKFEKGKTLTSDYLIIKDMSITPLRINSSYSPNYYLSYEGSYYYQFGQLVFGNFGTTFNISTDFVLDVYPNSSLNNAIPINTYQEFLEMQPNGHYILLNDITLDQTFSPIQTQVASFDGNGHTITLANAHSFSSGASLGIFTEVASGAVLKNIKIIVSGNTNILLTPEIQSGITFGVLAGTNNGAITNCTIEGKQFANLGITLPNQTAQNLDNYVSGLVGVNNGAITNSHISVNISSASNLSGLVGINNGKISSCFVRDSMIVNKSTSSLHHKTAGLVVQNGTSGQTNAQIIGSYVCGSTSTKTIYSTTTSYAINSMPSVSGFVYTNFGKITDCYSDILINTSSTSAGFVFENSGKIVRSYTTSWFTESGQDAYIFVCHNQVSSSSIGTYEDCFYLVGTINQTANKQRLNGLTELDDSDFSNPQNFTSFALSSNFNKHEGVWFYPSKDVETSFKNNGSNMKFTFGKPELVSANTIVSTNKVLDPAQTTTNKETGETVYSYIETLEPLGTTFNPILIDCAVAFETYFKNFSSRNINSKTYRLISDINYQAEEVYNLTTHNLTFIGSLEGNGMEISGFAIDSRTKTASAGVFSQIGQGQTQAGVVKNLTLSPAYINLPNASKVGVLAGTLESGRLFNITVNGKTSTNSTVTVVGQNAVGGVVGFASSGFMMKNITASVSVHASYSHQKSSKKFTLYQTSENISSVSYAGAIVGIATNVGSIYKASVLENITVIGEVCGLISGQVGKNTTIGYINQTVFDSHSLIPSVYGGVISGEVLGTLENIKVTGNAKENFIKKADSLTPATAVGGVTGLLVGGTLDTVSIAISLVWANNAPNIIGGLVGEMLGGQITNSSFSGEQISLATTNANLNISEIIVGGVVGKLSSTLSKTADSKPLATNSRLDFIQTQGTINLSIVNVHTVYSGGIIGQAIQTYDKDDTTKTWIDELNNLYRYETLPRYSMTLNSVRNNIDINISNIVYGGVVSTYVGGLVGGVHTDSGKLYAGEIVVQDEKSENALLGKYQSTSASNISVSVTDNKSTALVNTYYGGILGYGYAVSQHTVLEGTYDSRNNPWGIMLQNSLNGSQNLTSPEYDGKWQDEEKTTRAKFIDTKFMTITVKTPIITSALSNHKENAL